MVDLTMVQRGNSFCFSDAIYHKNIAFLLLNINPLETGDFDDKFHSVICLWSTIDNEEIFLQYFLVILKHSLQNY